MFSFLKRSEVDRDKAAAFAAWFAENEERIRKSVENRETDRDGMLAVLDEVEVQLALVYRDGYRGEIEFDYGGEGQEWELNLYHLNRKFLVDATRMIESELRARQLPFWRINVSE